MTIAVAMVHATINPTALIHKLFPTRGWGTTRSSYICKSSLMPCSRRVFASSPLSSDRSVVTDDVPSIHRKVIWFHHIKSSKKKKHIAEWGKELRLGGYCKPGFPGVLIFEGEGEHVTDFLKRIKRLRWQHLQVRGEDEEQGTSEDQSVETLRRFPMGIEELPESGMSELAEKCRDANLEQLFLTALKISR
ncbi:unnamed protein product [Calypogeia fissa]